MLIIFSKRRKKMKRKIKIIAIAMSICLLFGAVFAVFSSAASPIQSLVPAGTTTGGYLAFDGDTTNNKYDSYSGTWTSNMTGSKSRMYVASSWLSLHTNVLKTETVDGVTNKYLDITRDNASYSLSDSSTFFGLAPNTLKFENTDNVLNEYYVVDFDIKADSWVVDNTDGTKTLYDTWDDVVLAGKESEAKLSYPEGMYLQLDMTAYNVASDGSLSSAGPSTPKVYFVSKTVTVDGESRQMWYLRMYSKTSTSYGEYPLSNVAGDWNHITIVYKLLNPPKSTKLAYYAYVDGKYAGANETTYTGYTRQLVYAEETRFIIEKDTANKGGYSFGLDNFVGNGYCDYVPASGVENSITSVTNFKKDYAVYNCDDVLYNENYISPNGNSFALDWVDANGDEIYSEKLAIADTPTVDTEALKSGVYGAVKGDYSNLSAWEWNVGSDASVFTPVTKLTYEMVMTVRARGDYSITVRPAIVSVEWQNELGGFIGTESYFVGSTVEKFTAKTNGWYSTEYSAKSNATEGEEEGSFIIASGKNNIFVADESAAIPTASIEGIRYNMSLLTNYYMNIYVPADTASNVEFVGFYADEELSSKYTSGVRTVSIGDEIYHELTFGFANRDIDVDVPKYAAIEVTIGGAKQTLAYEISVNVLSYCKGVLSAYDCESEEASLVCNILNYANEAYKLANGEDNAAAIAVLSAHSDCACLLSTDTTSEHKGSLNGLSDYLYGAAYNVTTAQPSLMLYLIESKASEVSRITVSYDGFGGAVTKELSAGEATKVSGRSVIPYSFNAISACDVNEIMEITVYGKSGEKLSVGSYGLANYVFNNDIAVAGALYAFSKAAYNYKNSIFGEANDPVSIEGISATKESSLRPSATLALNAPISYTIKVTNNSGSAALVPVTDEIPANTAYASGDAEVNGEKLYWLVNVPAGETVEISYTVKVQPIKKLFDKVAISAPAANAGGAIAECEGENYVKRTLNSVDQTYLAKAISAISYSENIDAATLIRMMYNVAFSKYPSIIKFTPANMISYIFQSTATEDGSALRKMVIPTLYGGSGASSLIKSEFIGESAAIEKADLITGDIILVKDSSGSKMYIYNGEQLISVSDSGCKKADTDAVISAANSANYYVALRPSMVMTSLVSYTAKIDYDSMTAEQEALVKTAENYILRGYRLQYDDGGMASVSEYRWEIGKYQPEDYTEQFWRYINCAGFTYDVYRNSLGIDLESLYTTQALMRHFTNKGTENAQYPFYFQWDEDIHSDVDRQAEIQERFLSTLQVGDLVVVTRDGKVGGYGHVMLYVGNGMLIHSSGSSRSGDTEYYEATIRYMNVLSYLFDPNASNYLFVEEATESTVYQTCIVRPLNMKTAVISENTANRVENLYGVLTEKLSSHPEGMTVNKGDEITYTFKITNYSGEGRNLAVTDIVPENSTLVSAEGAIINGTSLKWYVFVDAGEIATVSYTVRATGEYGSYIYSDDATIGGVRHTCTKTYIEKTLTPEDEQAILEAVEYYRNNNTDALTGTALINAIYEYAGLEAPFVDDEGNTVSLSTIRDSLMKSVSVKSGSTTYSLWELNTDYEYYDMIVPTMYGGGKYYTKNLYSATCKDSSDRSRLPREQGLVFGDIVVARFSSSYATYMYLGSEHLININASLSDDANYASYHRLQRMLSAGNYYVILRPSMGDRITIEEKCTVSFETSGGSGVASVRTPVGTAISAPADPTRVQHEFLGWYYNGELYDFSTPVTRDITLVAEWKSLISDDEVFDGMQSVLLLGQSNMMGQGEMNTVDPISDDRLFMMRDYRWVAMREPLHTNSQQAGIGLGASFGKAFVETFDTQLGLIPAAKGATTLEDWAVGGALYNEAIRRAKAAQETSEICAILWHQGEGDQYNENYAALLKVILDSMIEELSLDPDKIVIITGELYGAKGNTVHTPQLVELGRNYKNYGIAQSDGLVLQADQTHFTSPSLRVFGYRYFDLFYNMLTGRNYEFVDDYNYYYSEQTPIDENTWFPFDELATGTAPAGACGSGAMGLYLQNGSASIVEESATDKYLSISNGVNDAGTGYTSTFVNSVEKNVAAGSAIVTEGYFKLGEGSDCDAYLLMAVSSEGTNAGVYKSVVIGYDGTLYTVNASGTRTAVGKVGTEDWVHVKVVLDLKNNRKWVYIDGAAVMENEVISNSVDTAAYAIESVSLVQFSTRTNTTIGTVHIDDYRLYPAE